MIKRKLCFVPVLAMMIGLLCSASPVKAVAVATKSSWSFQTGSGKVINVNETLSMKKNEFQDFNLYKSGVEIKENDSKYQITWSSSDPDVIWINSKTGKSRADRSKTMTEDYGEATITATIKNKSTNAVAYRKFFVTVGVKPSQLSEVKLDFEASIDPTETLELGKSYKYVTTYFDQYGAPYDVSESDAYYLIFFDEEALEVDIENETITTKKSGEHTITIAIFENEAAASKADSPDDSEIVSELVLCVEDPSPRITSINQTELTTVEITFNNEEYAKEVADNSQKFKMSYLLNGREIQSAYQMITVSEEDPKTLQISLYSTLTEGIEYIFRYEGKENVPEARLTGSGTIPAYIKLVAEDVEIESDYKIQVKIYNSAHVDITSVISYPLYFESLDGKYQSDYVLNDNTLFFTKKNVAALIKATLDMPYYDSAGNVSEDLYDIAYFSSVPKTEAIYNECDAYSIADNNSATIDPEKLDYQQIPKALCADDRDIYICAAFTYIDTKKNESREYVVKGMDSLGNSGYTYESTNESYLLVDRYTGKLYPLQKGSAGVLILNPKGETIGVATVRISDDRMLNTFAVINQGAQRMSATGDASGIEKLCYTIKSLDQNGEPIKDVQLSYRIVYPDNAAPFDAVFNHSFDGNTLMIWENGGLVAEVAPGNTRAFDIEVSAMYGTKKEVRTMRIVVKNTVGEAVKETELSVSQERIDLKLDKGSLDAYDSEIQVRTYDSSDKSTRYLIGLEHIKQVYSTAEISTNQNTYSVLIQRNGEAVTGEELVLDGKTITLKPVKKDGLVITKVPSGVYEIRLYKGIGTGYQLISACNIILNDTTEPILVSKKDGVVSGTELEKLQEDMIFTWCGKDISEYVVPIQHTFKLMNNLCSVSEIKARVYLNGLNDAWPDDFYIITDIQTSIWFTVR